MLDYLSNSIREFKNGLIKSQVVRDGEFVKSVDLSNFTFSVSEVVSLYFTSYTFTGTSNK